MLCIELLKYLILKIKKILMYNSILDTIKFKYGAKILI